MSKINTPPLGLQNLLGSQNFGDNPSELGQTVAPTLDLLPFYGAGLIRSKQTSGGRSDEGIISSVELFGHVAVLFVSAWVPGGLSATETCALGLSMEGIASLNLPGNQEIILASGELGAYQATASPSVTYKFDQPLVVESGVEFNSRWMFYAGAADTVQLNVVFYDLSPGQN